MSLVVPFDSSNVRVEDHEILIKFEDVDLFSVVSEFEIEIQNTDQKSEPRIKKVNIWAATKDGRYHGFECRRSKRLHNVFKFDDLPICGYRRYVPEKWFMSVYFSNTSKLDFSKSKLTLELDQSRVVMAEFASEPKVVPSRCWPLW